MTPHTFFRFSRLGSCFLGMIALAGCGLFEGIRSYTNIDGGRQTIAEEKSYSNYSNPHNSKFQGFFVGSTNYVRETNLARVIADESSLNKDTYDCSKLDPGECLSLAEKEYRAIRG